MICSAHRTGFSLIELSIVLVILGLLTGGILAGQSLIRAAELRSVSTESGRFTTALNSFRDKYFGLAGDIANATQFWGKDNTRCSGDTGTTATPGTCNGDGDGSIDNHTESYRLWQQLAQAGLIEGTYLGYISGSAPGAPTVAGRDMPATKAGTGGWSAFELSQTGNYEVAFTGIPNILNNYLIVGAMRPDYWANGPILRPTEAWNIDSKLDDGKPGQGKLRGGPSSQGCTADGASTTDYALSSNTPLCLMGFIVN